MKTSSVSFSSTNIQSQQPSELPRFQVVYKRLDSDNDGRINRKEFKIGLRKLNCSNESQWNLRLIKRFFEEIENDRLVPSGFLTITKLVQYIKNFASYNESSIQSEIDSGSNINANNGGSYDRGMGAYTNNNNTMKNNNSYNSTNNNTTTSTSIPTGNNTKTMSWAGSSAEDDEFFARRKAVAEQKLFQKVGLYIYYIYIYII